MGSADANKTLRERDEGVSGAGGLQPARSLRVALLQPSLDSQERARTSATGMLKTKWK